MRWQQSGKSRVCRAGVGGDYGISFCRSADEVFPVAEAHRARWCRRGAVWVCWGGRRPGRASGKSMSAALVASAWRVMRPATVSLPAGAHAYAGDAEAKAPLKKYSPFHYAASKTSFGMRAKNTERFLHSY